MNDQELEDRARDFAKTLHGHQKYGEAPYAHHLEHVRFVLATFGYNQHYGPAAWLHDVVEDCNVDIKLIETLFGAKPATLVWAVTGLGGSRRERNESIYQKLELTPDAIPLKLADRIANVESAKTARENNHSTARFFDMYFTEHNSFMDRLKPLRVEVAMWKRLNEALGVTP